jgi:hypothetical protein
MKTNLSEFWTKERKHDGKMKQDIEGTASSISFQILQG